MDRIWDAASTNPLPQGHEDSVYVDAFSPDGMHTVSGSMDKTLCLLDSTMGESSTIKRA